MSGEGLGYPPDGSGSEIVSGVYSKVSHWSTESSTSGNYNQAYSFPAPYSDTKIACRHLSFAFLVAEATSDCRDPDPEVKKEYKYRSAFASLESGHSMLTLDAPVFDTKEIEAKANQYWLITTKKAGESDCASIGSRLFLACSSMTANTVKFFLLRTCVHMMAIVVRYKEAQPGVITSRYFSVKFYDPNITLSHYRFIANTSEDLKKFSLDRVFQVPPTFHVAILAQYDNVLDNFDSPSTRILTLLGDENKELLGFPLAFSMKYGFNILNVMRVIGYATNFL